MRRGNRLLDRIVPARMRQAMADGMLWLVEPRNKLLASHYVGRHLLKDRSFLEFLKCRLESMDREKELFGEGVLCGHRNELLEIAVEKAKTLNGNSGLWMEFGVWQGHSVNLIAREYSGAVYGFDSFEGLPEKWTTGDARSKKKGNKRNLRHKLPSVKPNVTLVKGWFKDTLPGFVREHPEPAAFVHIDSDLYSSAKCVFEHVKFRDGSVIVFDEYFNYPAWKDGEYKAFKEFLAEHSAAADCIGFCPRSGQAAFTLRMTRRA